MKVGDLAAYFGVPVDSVRVIRDPEDAVIYGASVELEMNIRPGRPAVGTWAYVWHQEWAMDLDHGGVMQEGGTVYRRPPVPLPIALHRAGVREGDLVIVRHATDDVDYTVFRAPRALLALGRAEDTGEQTM